jgi:hypothetical protein
MRHHHTKKSNQKMSEPTVISVEAKKIDDSTENLGLNTSIQKHKNESRGYILTLILLAIGMIFQLSGHPLWISIGVLVCVSVCAFVCFSVIIPALISRAQKNP